MKSKTAQDDLTSWVNTGADSMKRKGILPPPTLSYTITVKGPGRSKSATVEAASDQTLAQLDKLIRREMDYDTWDHCSAFFTGKPWRSETVAEIHPDGGGENEDLLVGELGLMPGEKLNYVYDFGDNLEHVLTIDSVG